MALVFHGTLGAILVLYALYWLRLVRGEGEGNTRAGGCFSCPVVSPRCRLPVHQNIFDVLTYLTPLLVLLTFSGRATLLTLAKNRAKADKSD